MRQELDPATIVRTSDFIRLQGFRVVIRERPKNGEFGSGKNGTPWFGFAYRPGEEHGCTGFQFADHTPTVIAQGRASFFRPAKTPFEAHYVEAEGKVVTFEIDPNYLDNIIKRANLRIEILRCLPPPIFLVNKSIEYLISLLVLESESGAPHGVLYFDRVAEALLIAILSQFDSRLPDSGHIYVRNDQIERAVSYIESNFRSRLTISEIAATSRLSVSHFCRLFSRLTGLTPHEYILYRRLRFGERLLCVRGSNSSIAQIASEAGFADQAHFSRHFRRAFWKTPQEYRKMRN
jgi:AraC-like DNA-binding protein